MACTCRELPHCPTCNASVRLPLTYFVGGRKLTPYQRRSEHVPRFVPREDVTKLAVGRGPCPNCGETVEARHERRCVSENLAEVGVPAADRSRILGRVNFPE